MTTAIKKVYQGVSNYNEPLIVDGLIESIEKFSLTPAELDFLNSGQVTKARIFQAFGVSPFAVGQVENGNRAAMTVAQQTFAENVLNPLATLLSESMTAWLGPRFAGKGERLVVWVEPVIPRDEEIDLRIWELGLRFGCADRNEYRVRMMNLPEDPQFAGPMDPFAQMFRTQASRPGLDEIGGKQANLIHSWELDRAEQEVARRNGNGSHR